MAYVLLIALALLLSGCGNFRNSFGVGSGEEVVITRPPDLYTRAEVDALNAELQCRQLARTMLEAQRCGIRR
jgi:hypothetical protein